MDWIWQSLIGNLAVSALAISLWVHIKRRLDDRLVQLTKFIFGCLLGLSALVTMVLTAQVHPGVYFDLRSSLVGIAALFGGPVAGALALLPPLAYRLYLGGQGATAGASVIAASCVLGIVGHYWSLAKPVSFGTVLLLGAAIGSITIFSLLLVPGIVTEGRWLALAAPIFVLSFAATALAGYFLIDADAESAGREIAQAAFEQAPDFAYIKNAQGQFVAVNRTTAAYHGFDSPKRMLGLTDFDIITPDRAAELHEAEQKAMQGRTPITNLEEMIIDQDGDERWFLTSKVPLVGRSGTVIGISGVTRDITRDKQIATDLQESRNRLTYVMSEMVDGIALFHKEGTLLFSNERYRDLFPLTKAIRRPGIDYRDILQAVHDTGEQVTLQQDHQEWVSEAMAALKNGGDEETNLYDGRWLHIRTRPTQEATSIVIVSDITDAKRLELALRTNSEKLQQLSETDALTGLPNRRTLDNILSKEIARTDRSGTPLSLLMIDVDRFKAYNDHYGHLAGDECLRMVAQCVREAVKRPMDLAARYGGEEFAVVLPDTDEDGAYHVALAIADQLRSANLPHLASEKGRVTVSIGVGSYRQGQNGRSADELIRQADTALYGAKAAGRDRINGRSAPASRKRAI